MGGLKEVRVGLLRYPSVIPEHMTGELPFLGTTTFLSISKMTWGAGRSVRVRSGLGTPQALLIL